MSILVTCAQALVFILMVLISLFLILIILIQRGKGGGLVGAFGGMGGGSMFGTKTTDVFLKITIWTTVVWFVFCLFSRYIINVKSGQSMLDEAAASAPAEPTGDAATTEESATTGDAATGAAPADSAPAENAATTTTADTPAPADAPAEAPAAE